MKLHLPKKFQTALMAAFATVSFTTVSTASLGAAIFAFAGYQAAAEEADSSEQSEAGKAGQEEIRDNIRILQEKQDEENERDSTVDPVDWEVMERRAKNLEREGDAAAHQIAREAYEQMEAEIFNPAATATAPAQQQASTGSGELPSDDLGFTTNPYASSSPANSGPVFEVTPAAATTTDFLEETSTEEESTSPSSSGSSTPAPASSSGFGGSADSGYVPFGHVSANSIPLGVSAIPAAANGTPQLTPLGAAEANATNLEWRGSEGTWRIGGDVGDSPWWFTPEASPAEQRAFKDGDYARFTASATATVEGNVHAGSLQIDAGTEGNPIVVTINTPENTMLTADHVVSLDYYEEGRGYTNKIVKTGEGAVDFSVDDPNFKTQLDIQAGSATINFNQLTEQQNYRLYTHLTAEDAADVTLNVNGAGATNSVYFASEASISGVDNFIVKEGLKLHVDTSEKLGGAFNLDQANTTIRLGSTESAAQFEAAETALSAQHLEVTGNGDATFHTLYWETTDTTDHAISGTVATTVENLYYYGDVATTAVDDGSSLEITNLYMNQNAAHENKFYHAFQNGGEDPQVLNVTTLYVGNDTAYLGAASSNQGAKEGYQEAGTVNVSKIVGSGTLVLENNVEVVNDPNQGLTEVFHLDRQGSGYGNLAAIRLAAANDGTADRRKEVVVDFQYAFTLYSQGNLELQADADYTDYKVFISDSRGFGGNGIEDVAGHEIKDNSTAMIYSGVEGKRIKVQLYAATENNRYESSFGMSSGLDIDMSGKGSQTFKGDFSDFYGNVKVGESNPGTELHILNQKAALKIEDLTIRGEATLDVKNQNGANQSAVVKGTLEAKGGPTTAGSGNASVLDGDLTLDSTSTLNVSAAGGKGGLNLTGALTINEGAKLSDADWAAVGKLGWFEMYDLAFGVTDMSSFGDVDWSVGVDATTVFANTGLNKEEYYVRYSGVGTAGGNGSNVGTVYIYRIPEPTTGTLSLLALAALAARRRRK